MITLHVGWVGFHFELAMKGKKGERVCVLFLGAFGLCWWNKIARAMYMRCLRLSVVDAALVSDAPRIIRERVEERTHQALAEEREDHKFWNKRNHNEIHRLQEENRLANTKIHDLETTIRELARIEKEATHAR